MVNFKENEELKTLNHSCAHLMAQAIKHLYPQAKFWVGPVVAEGFYYDVDLGEDVIRDEDIEKIEKEMKKIAKSGKKIMRREVSKGMVLCKPGQIKPHSKFKASIYVLKKEEGGRHTPFHNKYRPQFYLRTMDCTGEITLPEGTEMVMPGDNVEINVELIYPVALNVGLRFAIREGGRTVGSGQITEILD